MTLVDLKPAHQSQPRSQSLSATGQKVLLAIILAAAVVAVYYPVHRQPFANYDDADYVTDNFHVKAGLKWTTVTWAFTTRAAANWHPVTWISHALDTQIFGLDPAGPHDVNVLFHIVNALLLFWVLQRATGFVGRSWMVAALFALHPLNVESVAWIAERKNLLSMFFFLLTLAAYRWYTQRPGTVRYLTVAALFALGLMSKPQVITLPFVLLLWDYWPLRRTSYGATSHLNSERSTAEPVAPRSLSSLVWEKVPLFALCVASGVITLRAQSAGGATSGYAASLRVGNALVSYARYLSKAFWPSHLALFYPYPLRPWPVGQVLASALLLLAITIGVALAHQRRYLTVGWLWFLGTLVPMIGVLQVGTQAMADRYAYLPLVGIFIMVCWLIADRAAQLRLSPILLRTGGIVVLVALALVSHRQLSYWNDHIALWTHALEVTQNNWIGENNLGTALLKAGRVEEAIPHFRRAAALVATDPNSIMNIGTYEQMHGNPAAAIADYRRAAVIARNPKTKARAYNNLGYAYKDTGNLADARTSFQHAVEADPEFVGAWISLGLTAQRLGDLPAGISAYRHALEVHASDFGYLLLAQALEKSGEQAQANAARQQAALMSNNLIAAQNYVDKLLAH